MAEAAKVIENTQRDINIALINELKIIHSGCHLNDENYLKMAKAIKKMADKKYIFGEGNAFQLHGFSQGRRFDAQPNGGASAACDEYMILIGETPFREGTYGRF